MNELQILADRVGASERTLRRAVKQGALRGTRLSPRRLRLPEAEKRYIASRWPLFASIREILRTEQNVRFALLFGSMARGDDMDSSDVDLVVEMRDASLDRIADLSIKLEHHLGRRVDLLTIEEARGNPSLLADAIAEGRVLIDREDSWVALQASEARLRRMGRRRDSRRKREVLARLDRWAEA
jgi:predicted nucleotidyltransferase